MESYKIENLTFTYPKGERKAIDNVSLRVKEGEFVTLCGKSGCGKTTLLRLLKTTLAPFGEREGSIYFKGRKLEEYDFKAQAEKIGFVMQSADNQLVTDKVWHELAFGLENMGAPTEEIGARVAEVASFFGIQSWFHKNVTDLSGGQKQLLNLASVMVMQPSVLILDEPTSQLDPIAAHEFMNALERINREMGVTVILSEHRLEEAFALCDRVVVMDGGKIIANDAPRRVGKLLKELNHDMYDALPTPMRVYGAVCSGEEYPLTVREGRMWLEKYHEENPLDGGKIAKKENDGADKETVIEVRDAWFRYGRNLPDVIKGMSLQIKKGELFGIVGGNGTGKTTALSLMSGLNAPCCGEVLIKGKKISKLGNLYNGVLGVLPQNPQAVFVKKTVGLDLLEMLSESGLTGEEKEKRVEETARLCEIEHLLHRHPYDLSGGEQQRAALGKILLKNPEILLLDEPTKGMDAHFKETFAEIGKKLRARGVTIVMVTHDIEFCAAHADRCAMFFDGGIISTGTPREFFAGKSFYTTSACRMARTVLKEAILGEDIILACGKKVEKREKQPPKPDFFKDDTACGMKEEKKTGSDKTQPKASRKVKKGTVITALIIFVTIPLTIYLGMNFFGGKRYYLTSLIIILQTLLPFCMIFEGRRPQARELVLISVMCAIAVAGRAAFAMLPQFKPVVALVIISGVCFGSETGFLVGVITAFVSNFFFGQGPWTPWQMFAFGLIGLVAGILFGKGLLKRTKASLCIFGFLAAVVIYGGIMNPLTVFMTQSEPTFEMIKAAYITGLPFDFIHGLSTGFFMWVLSEAMIDRIDRVKIKYGLIENS